MADESPVLELRRITKRFPGVLANDAVDFDLQRSEVHALLGENGAGKSTLMNVLYGLYHPDDGEILINGKPTAVLTPQEAEELFKVVESLKSQGKSIIFISHKLNEVRQIADRVT